MHSLPPYMLQAVASSFMESKSSVYPFARQNATDWDALRLLQNVSISFQNSRISITYYGHNGSLEDFRNLYQDYKLDGNLQVNAKTGALEPLAALYSADTHADFVRVDLKPVNGELDVSTCDHEHESGWLMAGRHIGAFNPFSYV